MSALTHKTVGEDEGGMRLDRWFGLYYPQLPFSRLQKLIRTGQVRVDKARVKTGTRLGVGQKVRVPPLDDAIIAKARPSRPAHISENAKFLAGLTLYEDETLFVLNKPSGLAVQGGSGTTRHVDAMLKSVPNKKGEAPRLVHRLDRDTSGCLLVAKTRAAAAHFGQVFRSRSARKIYWALVVGVPEPAQGRISCFLAKRATKDGEQMEVVEPNAPGAVHSMTHYSLSDNAGRDFAWMTLKPVTGRTHQLRVHMNQLGTPILGDPRYFTLDNWNWRRPEGLGEGLHLHARRLALPLPGGQRLDVSAPLPDHMLKTFDMLGFDAGRYDVQNTDPEEA